MPVDDPVDTVDIIDMNMAESVIQVDRNDGESAVLIHGAGWLMIPREGQIDLLGLQDGSEKSIEAPEAEAGIPWVTASSEGACVASIHVLQDDAATVSLIDPVTGKAIDLPGLRLATWSAGD